MTNDESTKSIAYPTLERDAVTGIRDTFSSEGARFYTKRNYLSFLEGIGRMVEDTCTLHTYIF